ncbi:MAG TPA: hypothetical protein IAC00_02175 [Candidatus Limivicinus faecipullorum]|nr:hypothetical protein [Candidatus Limivicinus faecipullorum]
MYSFENESPKWLPGREPEALRRRLEDLFRQLDSRFGGKCIIWEQWDHKAWDSEAVSLCRELGYSRGAAFLTAYGYSILDGARFIPAAPSSPPSAEALEAHHSLPCKELPASARRPVPEQTAVPAAPVSEPSALGAPAPQFSAASERSSVPASSASKVPAPRAPAPQSSTASERISVSNLGEDSSLFYTGSVTAILPYNNSGFVRRDLGGDYYFNIRDFAHHVELRPGLKVRFRLERRMDHKHHRMRLNAVELSVIALDPQQQDADGRQIHHGPQTIKTPED